MATMTTDRERGIDLKANLCPVLILSVLLSMFMFGGLFAPIEAEAAVCGANAFMYRSAASGNWNVNGNWEVSTDGGATWAAAGCWPSSANGAIQIRNGHTITVAANITVNQTTVDAGGTVIINTGITLTLSNAAGADLILNGTLVRTGTFTLGGASTMTVGSTGTYQHNVNNVNLPTATWSAGSLLYVTGVVNNALGGLNQAFSDITWDSPSQTVADVRFNQMTAVRNLTIANTGTGSLRVAAGANSSITLSGNYVQTGGTFNLSSGTGTGTLNVAGNFSQTGGTISETSTGSGAIVFNGAGTQTYTSGGTISNTINFTVNSGSTLQMAAAGTAVTGGGTFTLSSGATLGITSTAGITASGATGNIQVTGTRTYNTGANYIYNGSASQAVGNGLPATVNTLTINNAGAGGNNTVTLGGNTTVTNALTITAGTFDQGSANNLTVGSVSISFGATFLNTGTGSITLGGNLVNNGYFHIDGGGVGCNTGDTKITLTATAARTWSGSGSFQIFNVAMDHQTSSVGTIAVFGSTDNGNNTGFTFDVCSNAPTAVKLISFDATEYDGKVVIQWRTGHEVNNLGFNLYREEEGQRQLITPQPVAGSALMAGPGITLTAGKPYIWWDDLSLRSQSSSPGPVKYWLEDLDLNGVRTMYGPVTAVSGQGPLPALEQAATLSRLSKLQTAGSDASLTLKPRLLKTSAPEPGAVAVNTALPPQQLQWSLAGSAAVKIFIQTEGWYRITQPELASCGLGTVDPRTLQLFVNGRQVPLVLSSGSERRFGPQDYIEFYGKGLDTPSTDIQTYWLVAATTRGQRVTLVSGGTKAMQLSGFAFTTEARPRMLYAPAIPKNDEGDKFYGPVVWTDPAVVKLDVQHPDPAASARALLEVSLQGVMDGQHNVGVMLNGTQVGQVVFSGKAKGRSSFQISQSGSLQQGENVLQLTAEGGAMDLSVLDAVRLTYQHTYTADNDALRFTANGRGTITVSGFSSAGIRVMDITDPNYVQEVSGKVSAQGISYAVTVNVPATGIRTLLAFTDGQIKHPVAVTANNPSTWHLSSNRADMVIISHGDFLEALGPLKKFREGQGRSVALIDVEDIYDEFSFGNKDPKAIQDFLLRASLNWQKHPRFVLLTGDASVDPRDYLGYGHPDLVPTNLIETVYNETASDDLFADFNKDGLPEMAFGRIPAETSAEVAAVVSKIIRYEQQPEDTSWTQKALLVSDRGSSDVFDFETGTTEVGALLPAGFTVETIFRRDFGSDAAAAQAILNSINEGSLLVNYMGHGSEDTWGGSIFTAAAAETLTNGLKLPFFINMTCWNGWFPNPYTGTLAESLLKAGQGGAVAVWASSGLTEPDRQLVMDKQLMRLLFHGRGLTIGEATAQAKAAVSDMDVRRTWILFGDPATRLK